MVPGSLPNSRTPPLQSCLPRLLWDHPTHPVPDSVSLTDLYTLPTRCYTLVPAVRAWRTACLAGLPFWLVTCRAAGTCHTNMATHRTAPYLPLPALLPLFGLWIHPFLTTFTTFCCRGSDFVKAQFAPLPYRFRAVLLQLVAFITGYTPQLTLL